MKRNVVFYIVTQYVTWRLQWSIALLKDYLIQITLYVSYLYVCVFGEKTENHIWEDVDGRVTPIWEKILEV